MLQRLSAITAIALLSFCNNGTVDPTNSEFEQAKAKWAKVSTGNYGFIFSYNCNCLPEYSGPFKIWVKNEIIDSMYNENTKSVVSKALFKNYMSISNSFNWIDSLKGTNPKVDTVAYDTTLGFPRYANFDWEPVGADGSIGIIIDSVIIE